MKHNTLDQIKAFGMTNQMVEEDLSRIGVEYGIEVNRNPSQVREIEDGYYPQLELAFRAEAAKMAKHYEVFYTLEKSIRALVSRTIETAHGTDWWTSEKVPQAIQSDVKGRISRETDAGITLRSSDELDYTTFGELSVIITSNWEIFGSLFTSKKAVEKVMASLNTLRNPIAHCSPLGEDEELRLRLTVRDWFRLME